MNNPGLGFFAKYINTLFPDKKFHLFDSFEGFRDGDSEYECGAGRKTFVNGGLAALLDLDKTSIAVVLNQMPNRENCVVHKGFFPESAVGVDDTFCFVHLDMDLFKPMLAAMHFFWDKLVQNGVLLLHDYNHAQYHGVADAVKSFEEEKGKTFLKFVCRDNVSMAIIKTEL